MSLQEAHLEILISWSPFHALRLASLSTSFFRQPVPVTIVVPAWVLCWARLDHQPDRLRLFRDRPTRYPFDIPHTMGQSLLSYLLVTLAAVHTLQAVEDGRKPHRLARREFPQPTTTLVSPAYEAPLPSIANPEASVNVNAPNNQALVPQGTNYNQQFKQNSTVVPGTNAFLQTLDDPCLGLPLTSETWKRLDLDNYLSLYPNGQATSLQVTISDSFGLIHVKLWDLDELSFLDGGSLELCLFTSCPKLCLWDWTSV